MGHNILDKGNIILDKGNIILLITRMKKITLLVFLIQGGFLWSHPHVFIDHSVKIVANENGITGLSLHWVFDEMFSSMLIQDFDMNKNGKIDPDENKIVKKKGFDNLKQYNYLVYAKINSRSFYPNYVHSFRASISNKRLIYTFFVPMTVAPGKGKTIEVAIKDPSNYADLTLKKQNPVSISSSGKWKLSSKVIDNRAKFRRTGEGFPEKIIIKIE